MTKQITAPYMGVSKDKMRAVQLHDMGKGYFQEHLTEEAVSLWVMAWKANDALNTAISAKATEAEIAMHTEIFEKAEQRYAEIGHCKDELMQLYIDCVLPDEGEDSPMYIAQLALWTAAKAQRTE